MSEFGSWAKKSFVWLGLYGALFTVSSPIIVSKAEAIPMVTYSWTTTSEGYGLNLGQPSTATFEVPLSDVQAGIIPQLDVTNIQLAYPGLSFTGTTTSSIGNDFAAYVNPLTGAFVYHDTQQGFSVFAYAPDLFNYDTFLSITVDNPVSGSVKDQYNAFNHNNPAAGYPTAGYWTATFPVAAVPELSTWAMMISGFLGLGVIAHRKRKALAFS